MAVTSLPYITAQLLAARSLVGADQFINLIVGQIGTDGTATAEVLYQDVESMTNAEVKVLFGTKSELTGRIMRARYHNQGRTPLQVLALDAAAGTAADLDIVTAGVATEDGTITMKVIDAFKYTINVDVLSGETAAQVATKIKAEIDLLTDLPATAGVIAVATFTLTANDVGTLGNKYTVKVTQNVAGITVTAGQFTGGATDPVTTTLFDNVTTDRFHAISWAWENNFTDVKSFLEPRNVIDNAFLEGVAFIGYDDTEANISTKVNGGTPLNSLNLLFMGNRQITGESVIVTPPDWRCAEFIAIRALRQSDGAPISQFVSVSAPRDVVGNAGLASLAYYGTPLPLCDIADANLLFTGQEQSNLKDDGYTIVGVNSSNTSAIMGEVVSTYKFKVNGDPDVSFKYLNYIDTGYLCLEIYFKTLKSTYSQSRLTEGALVAGRAIANKESIAAKYTEIYKTLGSQDFVLTQGGGDAEKYFYNNLAVDTVMATGTVNTSGILPIVTQIRSIDIVFQLAFTIGG